MIDVKTLIENQLKKTTLDILVFGPAVDPPSADPHVASLQVKRKEIKRRLLGEGHFAAFGEDVVDPSLPAHLADPLLQEIVAMRAADLIIVLVGSPGAIAEATTIAREKDLCGKAEFYCFEDHKDGLVVRHLRLMASYGASCRLVSLADVQACNLTGAVIEKVRAVQVGKAFLF
jgi:hypothetical protein